MAEMTDRVLFIGVKGTVLALDRVTGMELWRTELKGSDYVNIVLKGDDLLAATRGEVFCLESATGAIRWNNPLKGLGWGLVSFATFDTSAMATAAQYQIEQERRRNSD